MEYAKESMTQVNILRELFEQRKYLAIIDKVFPLERIVEAHQHLESGNKKGNTVIKM